MHLFHLIHFKDPKHIMMHVTHLLRKMHLVLFIQLLHPIHLMDLEFILSCPYLPNTLHLTHLLLLHLVQLIQQLQLLQLVRKATGAKANVGASPLPSKSLLHTSHSTGPCWQEKERLLPSPYVFKGGFKW